MDMLLVFVGNGELVECFAVVGGGVFDGELIGCCRCVLLQIDEHDLPARSRIGSSAALLRKVYRHQKSTVLWGVFLLR